MKGPQVPAVAFVGPCPEPTQIQEGWMSRINSIDRQLNGLRRVYLNFAKHHSDWRCEVIWRDDEHAEAYVNPAGPRSAALISRILDDVRLVYVHTLHLAEYILPWLATAKICVDIHGVTPEEEVMMGRPHLRERYEAVEQAVLKDAYRCIAVSDAMIEYYAEKYPDLHPNWLTIPVIETFPEEEVLSQRFASDRDELPVNTIYCGGTQAWQNIDAMLALVNQCGTWAKFRFYSHDHALLSIRAKALGLKWPPEIGFCRKDNLPGVYRAADFGLILRDDSPVNRVSSPTKLAEYLHFGVVPIVRTERLGDFFRLGFAYVTEEEFREGFIPGRASREWMVERNLGIIAQLADRFHGGIQELRKLLV